VADIEAESRGRKISKSDVVRERLRACATPARRRTASLTAIGRPDRIGGWPTERPNCAEEEYCTPRVMARNVLVDAGFVVALLSSRDRSPPMAVDGKPLNCLRLGSTCEAFCPRLSTFSERLGTPISEHYFARRSAGHPSHLPRTWSQS